MTICFIVPIDSTSCTVLDLVVILSEGLCRSYRYYLKYHYLNVERCNKRLHSAFYLFVLELDINQLKMQI